MFGHDVGDDVLMHLSHTIQEELRNIDFIGRYAEEEFLLILPNTDYDEDAYIAERLRRTIYLHNSRIKCFFCKMQTNKKLLFFNRLTWIRVF